jgi:hypothetical protein
MATKKTFLKKTNEQTNKTTTKTTTKTESVLMFGNYSGF